MDYKAFFADVELWIGQANQVAMQHGMEHEAFWAWVADSTSAMCKKYNDSRLVLKQMMMLAEWLEDVRESRKAS